MQCDVESAEPPRPCREVPDREGDGALEGAYAMFSAPIESERRPPLMVKVALDGRAVDMELNTGASIPVCSYSVF